MCLWRHCFTHSSFNVDKVGITPEICAPHQEPDGLCGRVPPEHAHGDVGAVARLCVPPTTHKRRTMYRSPQRVRYSFLDPAIPTQVLTPAHSSMPQVMVLSSEGYFYSYNIDLENGGECSLMKQYRYVLTEVLVRLSFLCSFQHMFLPSYSCCLPLDCLAFCSHQ